MGTKTELLQLLEAQKGQYVSGEAAAQQLGVSRAAVWKALKSLRAQGLMVESAPGRGYRLAVENDLLSHEAMEAWLDEGEPPVQVQEEIDSTNLAAKRWALEGAPHGSMVVAVRQTAGRGRLGRGFSSPPGGLYMSVVLRPKPGAGNAALITSAAAVAACRTVAQLCGVELGIKWVNDLYLEGRKCCGILTEAGTSVETGDIEYMVVGIGINYTTPAEAFEKEVRKVATALFPGGPAPVPRARLALAVRHSLLDIFEKLETREYLEEYRRRSVVLGKTVTVMANPPYPAKAVAIDDEAHLVVETPQGERQDLSYGEISIQL